MVTGMSSQFQLYRDAAGEYRWRLLAENNHIVAQSATGYDHKVDARRAIEILRERGLAATPEIYQDESGRFRFRVAAPNGATVAHGDAYANQVECAQTVRLVQRMAGVALVSDETRG